MVRAWLGHGWTRVAVCVFVAAAMVFWVASAFGVEAAGPIASGAARASAATCQRVQTANVGHWNVLRGVSVISSRNAWAVGYYNTASGQTQTFDQTGTLIERWNGRSWKIQASPKLAGGLYAVAATSSTNAWAVGHDSHGGLIEHWNGKAWKIQRSPKLARTKYIRPFFTGVAATSPTNAWAVGRDGHGGVIEHWNGRSWKIQARPKLRYATLSGVAATSSTNAWAVGDYYTASGLPRTLIERWNGRSWKIQASPNPRGVFGDRFQTSDGEIPLMGVAATSSTNAWAVGYGYFQLSGDGEFETQTLIERWNGRSWKIQRSPNGEPTDNQLFGVAATSSTDAWAVGYPIKAATIWQWNGGKAWKAQASPKRGGMALYAVASKSSEIWAVGANWGTAENRLSEFFDSVYFGSIKGLAVHCENEND